MPYQCLIRECADDEERREIALTLNADRRQLTEEERRQVALELRGQGKSYRAIERSRCDRPVAKKRTRSRSKSH